MSSYTLGVMARPTGADFVLNVKINGVLPEGLARSQQKHKTGVYQLMPSGDSRAEHTRSRSVVVPTRR